MNRRQFLTLSRGLRRATERFARQIRGFYATTQSPSNHATVVAQGSSLAGSRVVRDPGPRSSQPLRPPARPRNVSKSGYPWNILGHFPIRPPPFVAHPARGVQQPSGCVIINVNIYCSARTALLD